MKRGKLFEAIAYQHPSATRRNLLQCPSICSQAARHLFLFHMRNVSQAQDIH
ncbi:hypothetical protein D3C73_675160 [compost metagenome]